MGKTGTQDHQSDLLRHLAEKRLRERFPSSLSVESLTRNQIETLVHDFQVYQIELEVQTEELRRIHEELEALKDRYVDLYDFAPVGYVTVTQEGLIAEANLTACRLLGVERVKLTRMPFSRFVCPESGDAFYRHLREVFETQSKKISEIRLARRDGTQFFAQLESIAERGGDGELEKCRIIVSDISERKTSEEVLRQVDRFQAIADLTSGIAHNFNNLIQIVIGNATLGLMNLQFGNVAEVKENLQQIVESARFGAETVVRLNTYARGCSEDETATIEIFDLSDLVTQAVEMSKPWWKSESEKHGIGISLGTRLREGCLIRGRKNEMFEVLVNLIRNAVAALPRGGELEVVTAVMDRSVILKVKDTGIGISEVNLKRLFTPFFSTSHETGRGLGLATSRRIVERHGGTILADSVEGKGSIFTIHLPLVSEKPPEREPAELPGDHEAHTILVVDDREPTVKMLKAGLGRFGHTVFTALSGREAITMLKHTTVDLIICDLGMPDMNGWQVGKKVKDVFREKGIPKPAFVIFTGWENQGRDRGKIVEAGVDAVVQKPIDIAKLLITIGEITKKATEH